MPPYGGPPQAPHAAAAHPAFQQLSPIAGPPAALQPLRIPSGPPSSLCSPTSSGLVPGVKFRQDSGRAAPPTMLPFPASTAPGAAVPPRFAGVPTLGGALPHTVATALAMQPQPPQLSQAATLPVVPVEEAVSRAASGFPAPSGYAAPNGYAAAGYGAAQGGAMPQPLPPQQQPQQEQGWGRAGYAPPPAQSVGYPHQPPPAAQPGWQQAYPHQTGYGAAAGAGYSGVSAVSGEGAGEELTEVEL